MTFKNGDTFEVDLDDKDIGQALVEFAARKVGMLKPTEQVVSFTHSTTMPGVCMMRMGDGPCVVVTLEAIPNVSHIGVKHREQKP